MVELEQAFIYAIKRVLELSKKGLRYKGIIKGAYGLGVRKGFRNKEQCE